jgi:hypothetical protein
MERENGHLPSFLQCFIFIDDETVRDKIITIVGVITTKIVVSAIRRDEQSVEQLLSAHTNGR